jgi:hypothetical protein
VEVVGGGGGGWSCGDDVGAAGAAGADVGVAADLEDGVGFVDVGWVGEGDGRGWVEDYGALVGLVGL